MPSVCHHRLSDQVAVVRRRVAVLLIACVAVVAGAMSFTAIGNGPPRHPSGPSRSSGRAGPPRSRCASRLRLQPSAGCWARCARAGRPTSSEPIRPGPPPSPWTARARGSRTAGTPAAHLLSHGDLLRPHPRPRPLGDTCRDRAVPDDPHDLGGTGTAQCALPASAPERPSVVRRTGCTSSATSPTARTPQPSARVREMSFRPFDRPLQLLGLNRPAPTQDQTLSNHPARTPHEDGINYRS